MGKIKIGWASRDITIDATTDLPGHIVYHISEGVYDPISLTALVVEEEGADIAIFLGIDTMSMQAFLLDEIRAKVLEKNPEIPINKILANSTHAHTTPSHLHDYGGKLNKDRLKILGYTDEQIDNLAQAEETLSLKKYVDTGDIKLAYGDDYREFLSDQASNAICEAYDKRREAGIGYGYGYAVVAHSRRTVYFDDLSKRPGVKLNALTSLHGHAMMYGDPNDDQFSHYEAGADHFINIMYTFDPKGNLTGAIINIPCPSQNTEGMRRITADYWSDIRSAIRKTHGDIYIIPQSAAGGDLSPRILHYKKAQARRFALKYGDQKLNEFSENLQTEILARRDIAERVAWAFDEVLSWAKKDIKTDAKIIHAVETFELSRRIITDEEYNTALSEISRYEKMVPEATSDKPFERLRELSFVPASINRFRRVVMRYEIQKEQPKLPTEVHIIRIGDIAFASNRFELYMDYQHRIQARSPFEQTFIVQLAGQPLSPAGSYLCTERARQGKGYSASMFCNQVSCEGGQELVNETLRVLHKIHN